MEIVTELTFDVVSEAKARASIIAALPAIHARVKSDTDDALVIARGSQWRFRMFGVLNDTLEVYPVKATVTFDKKPSGGIKARIVATDTFGFGTRVLVLAQFKEACNELAEHIATSAKAK